MILGVSITVPHLIVGGDTRVCTPVQHLIGIADTPACTRVPHYIVIGANRVYVPGSTLLILVILGYASGYPKNI